MRFFAGECRPSPASRTGRHVIETLPWIAVLAALTTLAAFVLLVLWLVRRPRARSSAADRMGAFGPSRVFHRRAPRLQAAPRSLAASRRAVQAAAGALLAAERSGAGALLVRPARRDQRHLRGVQRERTRPRCHRPRHRPRQLAPHPADQAVGSRRLPDSLLALPRRQLADGRRAAAARAERHRRDGARTAARHHPAARPRRGTRHARQHGREPACPAHRALAGLLALPGFVLRPPTAARTASATASSPASRTPIRDSPGATATATKSRSMAIRAAASRRAGSSGPATTTSPPASWSTSLQPSGPRSRH